MGDRCTGACCERFFLPKTIDEYRELAEAGRLAEEDRAIPDMLVLVEPAEGGFFYACKHLLPSKDCAIYEARPKMCRDYPYGKRCRFPGCEWDEARRRRLPIFQPNAAMVEA